MEAKFNKLYENQGFFDRYNGSVFGTVFLVFVFFILFSYIYVKKRVGPIKSNWTAERCSPAVIPFAGLINPPNGKSGFEFTYENFNFCINNIIKETASYAMAPIEAVINLLSKTFGEFESAINDVRKLMSEIRSSVSDVSQNIMTRMLNILIPFQKMLISVKSIMGRAHATTVTGMYAAIGSLWFLISGLLNIYNLIIIIVAVLIATVAGLWLIPFGFGIPEALVMTGILVSVSVPLGIVGGAIKEIIDVTGVNHTVKSVPSCFKKDTLLRGMNNTLYSIDSIPLGTQLLDGGKVTAKLKLDASKEDMFKLGNVSVSGSHKVLHKNTWIFVKDHPRAVLDTSFTDRYIYCLNTSKKFIKINGYTFYDWDEVDTCNIFKYGCQELDQIHKKLENGFHESTTVNIKSKGYIKINLVEVGDTLSSGEKVVGVVKIANEKPLYEYSGGFLGTKQLSVIQDIEKNPVLSNEITNVLYHILTDKGIFYIKEQKIMDYNWNLDFFNVEKLYK